MIRRRVVVRGTVQGVFFRATCQQEARRCHVNGWVSNRSDGSVEAVFEGAPIAVESMLEWAHHGPPRAVVESVDVTDEEPTGTLGFTAR
ncbi:acylphosphatase [Aeromicrobium sp.]|uniref:acylphosphatase n=1 Tax=Aeromicrobium sp. TaxID=1871063 RepID=UPI003C5D1676